MNKKILLVLASICIFGVIFYVASSMYKEKEISEALIQAKSSQDIFIRDYSPRLGREDAKVKLVEFFDPECESCRKFHPFVKDLLQEKGEQVQLILRYAPFHGNSALVIRILEAARKQDKYWETLDVLFKYQPQWGSHHDPRPDLIWTFLKEVDLDLEKLRSEMNDPEIEKIIQQDISDGQSLGVRATPTFFVNGRPLENFGFEPLRDAVERALQE